MPPLGMVFLVGSFVLMLATCWWQSRRASTHRCHGRAQVYDTLIANAELRDLLRSAIGQCAAEYLCQASPFPARLGTRYSAVRPVTP